MRRELAQAREEAERSLMEERNRNAADLDFARSQKSELDAVLAEQEARLQALTSERDSAVAEQQAMREQFNSLRAEVEIARGVINANGSGEVEDPVRLLAELEEARKKAFAKLKDEAAAIGAQAIVGVAEQLHRVGDNGFMLLLTGTAMDLKKAEPVEVAVAQPQVVYVQADAAQQFEEPQVVEAIVRDNVIYPQSARD